MKHRKSSLSKNWFPVPIAVTVILLGAIVAVGTSNVEGGFLRRTLQSVASVPGLSWVAAWIEPISGSDHKPSGMDHLLADRLSETKTEGNVLLANGFQNDQTIASLHSFPLLTPTPLPSESSIHSTMTATSDESSSTTTALPNESPTITSVDENTPSPTVTAQGTATPTATELPGTRHLLLSSIEVTPGEKFQVNLYCDNTEDVAGCDIGLEFEPNLLDLVTVHKTDITDPFLLVKRKESGTFILSLAGLDGLNAGKGVLLTFEGVASSSMVQNQVTVVSFIKAKLYNTNSKAFEVRTANGMVRIKSDPTEAATEVAQQTLAQEEEPTSIPTTSTEVEDEPVPEATSSLPLTGSTIPPPVGGEGYPIGDLPNVTPVFTLTLTRTPPAAVSLEAATPTPTPTRFRADINKDGEVNSLDLMEFMRSWKQVFTSN